MVVVCQKCGQALKPGELRYQVQIDLISMYDGYLEEPAGDVDEELDRLIESISKKDPEELAKDVAQSISLVICRACRNRLVKDYEVKNQVLH